MMLSILAHVMSSRSLCGFTNRHNIAHDAFYSKLKLVSEIGTTAVEVTDHHQVVWLLSVLFVSIDGFLVT